MSKTISRRKGGLNVSRKGKISYSPGSVRVGSRKAGVNLSRRGASGSIRTPIGTVNTRRGCRFTFLLLCAVPVALAAGIARLLA